MSTEPLYHHCRGLDYVTHGVVRPDLHYADPYFKESYEWLAGQVGFYPLFIAVGSHEDDLRNTGYHAQWRRIIEQGPKGNKYRKRGEFPNDVLFSFNILAGRFIDGQYWYIALNGPQRVSSVETNWILKPAWTTRQWLKKALTEPCSVQFVAPQLDLRAAERIWTRNKPTKKHLEQLGFDSVDVQRLRVSSL